MQSQYVCNDLALLAYVVLLFTDYSVFFRTLSLNSSSAISICCRICSAVGKCSLISLIFTTDARLSLTSWVEGVLPKDPLLFAFIGCPSVDSLPTDAQWGWDLYILLNFNDYGLFLSTAVCCKGCNLYLLSLSCLFCSNFSFFINHCILIIT